MNTRKKFLGIALLFTFVFSLAACGNDKTWALKNDESTVPNGVYLYFLFNSYNDAIDQLSQSGATVENLENQTIADKKVTEWIQDEAVTSCKNMMAIEKMFNEKNLSLSDEENENADKMADSFWEYSGERVEKFGISKDDFKRAYPLTTAKTQKLFNSIYGKDGTQAVSDDELLNFYKNTYVKISLISKASNEALAEDETVKQDNVTAQTDAQIEEQFKGYVNSINSGEKNIEAVAVLFQQSENLEMDPIETEVMNPNDEDLSADIRDLIKNLEVGKAAYTRFNDSFILVYKNDMGAETVDLSDDSVRSKILQDMKYNEFESSVKSTIDGMKIKVNYDSINDYDSVGTFKES